MTLEERLAHHKAMAESYHMAYEVCSPRDLLVPLFRGQYD